MKIKLSDGSIDEYSKIYVGMEKEWIEEFYFSNIIAVIICICCMGLMMIPAVSLSDGSNGLLKNGYYLEKNQIGGADEKVQLHTSIGDVESDTTIDIPAIRYTEEEEKIKFAEAEAYVRDNYLGDNESEKSVSKKLNLMTEIPDSAINIKWKTDTREIISKSGEINMHNLLEIIKKTEEGKKTKNTVNDIDAGNTEEISGISVFITAVLSYVDKRKNIKFELTVVPGKQTKEERVWRLFEQQLKKNTEDSKSDVVLKLPEKIDGEKVVYKEQKDEVYGYVIAVLLIAMLSVPWLEKSMAKKQIEDKQKIMRLAYPEFIEKFILLISAGLTIKSAWYRMTDEYASYESAKFRFLFEEMNYTKGQMENGLSEAKAYEQFGRRTGILSYMKFSTMLVQNLKKGNGNLLEILEYESSDGFRQRLENAKMYGEEAGTKLLFPMMLMLMEVCGIIMFAAFQSM